MYETLAHSAVEPSLSLKPFWEDFWWPVVENRQSLETIRVSTEYASEEHLRSGVTLINDILEAPFADAGKRLLPEAAILRKAGMSGVLSQESNERISTESGELNLAENKSFFLTMRASENYDKRYSRCHLHTPHSPVPSHSL